MEYLSYCDTLSKKPKLLIKGNERFKTIYGAFSSIFIICLMILVFIILAKDIWNNKKPHIIINEDTDEQPYLKLTYSPFIINFYDLNGEIIKNSDKFFTIKAFVYNVTVSENENNRMNVLKINSIDNSVCTNVPEKLYISLLNSFSHQKQRLNKQSFCLNTTDPSLNLRGAFNDLSANRSFLNIQLEKCKNSTENKDYYCYPKSEIEKQTPRTIVEIKYLDHKKNLENFTEEKKPYLKSNFYDLKNNMQNKILMIIQNTEFQIDSGSIFENLSKYSLYTIKEEKRDYKILETEESLLLDISFGISDLKLTYYVNYDRVYGFIASLVSMWNLLNILGRYANEFIFCNLYYIYIGFYNNIIDEKNNFIPYNKKSLYSLKLIKSRKNKFNRLYNIHENKYKKSKDTKTSQNFLSLNKGNIVDIYSEQNLRKRESNKSEFKINEKNLDDKNCNKINPLSREVKTQEIKIENKYEKNKNLINLSPIKRKSPFSNKKNDIIKETDINNQIRIGDNEPLNLKIMSSYKNLNKINDCDNKIIDFRLKRLRTKNKITYASDNKINLAINKPLEVNFGIIKEFSKSEISNDLNFKTNKENVNNLMNNKVNLNNTNSNINFLGVNHTNQLHMIDENLKLNSSKKSGIFNEIRLKNKIKSIQNLSKDNQNASKLNKWCKKNIFKSCISSKQTLINKLITYIKKKINIEEIIRKLIELDKLKFILLENDILHNLKNFPGRSFDEQQTSNQFKRISYCYTPKNSSESKNINNNNSENSEEFREIKNFWIFNEFNQID